MEQIILGHFTQELSVSAPWKTFVPDKKIHFSSVSEPCATCHSMKWMNVENQLIKNDSNAVVIIELVDRPFRSLVFRSKLRMIGSKRTRFIFQCQVVQIKYVRNNIAFPSNGFQRYQNIVGLDIEITQLKIKCFSVSRF